MPRFDGLAHLPTFAFSVYAPAPMSAIATGREARWPAPPSWLQTVGAVLVGTLLATVTLIVAAAALSPLHLLPAGGAPGHGWPWRIHDTWSFAADLGPLLAFGYAVAIWTGLFVKGTRRLPFALTVAACGWIPVNGGNAGLLRVGGLVAFVAVVIVARASAAPKHRPLTWAWPR